MSNQANNDRQADPRRAGRRRLVLVVVVGLVIVAAVLLTVFFAGDNDGAQRQVADDADDTVTDVTSPYDFTELPEDSGPAEVDGASYVSILLVDDGGQMTGYGLSARLPAAEALTEAVRAADQADPELLSTLPTAAASPSGDGSGLGPTLTFVFPDRGTLTFNLYVQQGLVARGDRVWRVKGDLAQLIEAAVAAGNQ